MLLTLEQVSLSYGSQPILEGLNFSLEAGEVVSILGANGAGKSSLLKCILGLHDKQARMTGEITINGSSMRTAPNAARAHIAYVPEQPAVYGHLSGFDNVCYFLGLTNTHLAREEIEACLAEVDLPKPAWHQPCRSYSKGMRQKIMLALALARKSKLLLLDEPNSGLDPKATEELNQWIMRCKPLGFGVLVVSHDVISALEFSDTLYILKQGSLHPVHMNRDTLSFNFLKALY